MNYPIDPTMQTILLVFGVLWLLLFFIGKSAYNKVQKQLVENRKTQQASLKLSRMAYNKAMQCYEVLSTESEDGIEDEEDGFTDDGDGGDLPN